MKPGKPLHGSLICPIPISIWAQLTVCHSRIILSDVHPERDTDLYNYLGGGEEEDLPYTYLLKVVSLNKVQPVLI